MLTAKFFPLGGNMRLRAIKELGKKFLRHGLMADEWTEEQRRDYKIKECKFDWDLEDYRNWDLDLISEWGRFRY